MRITNKISLLIIFLLGALTINTWVDLKQMSKIRSEFAAMADYDVSFMESVTTIHQLQLQKNILLQQLIGIAEELGFEQVNFARSSYLRDRLKNIQEGMAHYAQLGAREIVRARRVAAEAMEMSADRYQQSKLRQMINGLNRLEQVRRNYDVSIERILGSVQAGGFQLSLEDLESIQHQENDLSKGVEELLKQIQGFSRTSLARAVEWENEAQRALLFFLGVTVVIGCLLALWIVRSITRPLRALSLAARQIGEGNFSVRLGTSSGDELAQLAGAFNTMSKELEEFRLRLEKQNTHLKEANEELDKFIQIMGHDIANPLTVMIAYCAYLEQHAGPLDPKSQESLQGIRRSSTKMHQMVKDLLEFNKSKRLKN